MPPLQMAVRVALEPRSGERYLAWGVSPRDRYQEKFKAPEGRQKKPRLAASVAAPRLNNFCQTGNLGLTPQAIHLSRLRRLSSSINRGLAGNSEIRNPKSEISVWPFHRYADAHRRFVLFRNRLNPLRHARLRRVSRLE